jgi:outer membrane protein OmpA-like peptidoglycan-associated protein
MLLYALLTAFSLLSGRAEASENTGLMLGLGAGYVHTDPYENLDSTWVVVPRLGYGVIPYLLLEVDGGIMQGRTRATSTVYNAYTPRLNLLVLPWPEIPVRPFLAVGGGFIYKEVSRDESIYETQSNAQGYGNYKNPDTDGLINVGPGLLIPIAPVMGIRLDARYLLNLGSEPHGDVQDAFNNFEYTGSFAFWPLAGRRDKDGDGITDHIDACPEDPEDYDRYEDSDGCPDPDNDRDGILDVGDDCPLKAEDFDNYADNDGCPDPDNDGDGLTDDVDGCPDDPEDLDGYKDRDGCPEDDNDGDGIIDLEDDCPNKAEDFDGFEDTDGCVDPDNDRDGIPDGEDECRDEPEVYNGYTDEDGCPDDTPKEVERFTGAIRGINFEVNSDRILPSSFGILDEAVAVLLKYDTLRLEIQGHTDSDGPDDYNLELSQRRAQSVVNYFVGKGVDASRFVARGYGESVPLVTNDTAANKAFNRRVEFQPISGTTTTNEPDGDPAIRDY